GAEAIGRSLEKLGRIGFRLQDQTDPAALVARIGHVAHQAAATFADRALEGVGEALEGRLGHFPGAAPGLAFRLAAGLALRAVDVVVASLALAAGAADHAVEGVQLSRAAALGALEVDLLAALAGAAVHLV